MLRGVAANAAQANQSESRPRDFARAYALVPQFSLPPQVLLLVANILGNPLGESKDERDDVLGHHRSVDLAGIGKDDIARNELGIQELMNRRRGRVHPAQLVGELQLLSPYGKSKGDIGFQQLLFHVVVTGKPDNFGLRKLFSELIGEP